MYENSFYETLIETKAELLAWITATADQIQNIPAVFEDVRQPMLRRCHFCRRVNGEIFEHLL